MKKIKKTVAVLALSAVTAMTAMLTGCSFVDKIKEEIDHHFGSTPETETTACVEHTDDDFDYLCDECDNEVFYDTELYPSGEVITAGKYRVECTSESFEFVIVHNDDAFAFDDVLVNGSDSERVVKVWFYSDSNSICIFYGMLNYNSGYINFVVDENTHISCSCDDCTNAGNGGFYLLGKSFFCDVQKITGIHTVA